MKNYSKGSTSLSVSLPAELVEKLNDKAQREGTSRNLLIRQAIEEKLQREER
jgi:metal-responsive CopG/Arc/MetJ family transcriptional regulator